MCEVLKICPTENELSEVVDAYACTDENCNSSFKSASNLKLHIVKHHRVGQLQSKPDGVIVRFFCPRQDCVYNASRGNEKFFTQKRLLKQHFMKVHAPKNYSCDKCGMKTSLVSAYNRHMKVCGAVFSCDTCGWKYSTSESLLVHLMRKHPRIHEAYLQNKVEEKRKSKNGAKKINLSKDGVVLTPQSIPTYNKDKLDFNVFCTNYNTLQSSIDKEDSKKLSTNEDLYNYQDSSVIYSQRFSNLNLEHNYAKNINLDECATKKIDENVSLSTEDNKIKLVNILNKLEDQLIISNIENPTYALVPIHLLNRECINPNKNVNIKNTSKEEVIQKNNELLSHPKKILPCIKNNRTEIFSHEDRYTQTCLRKKSKTLAVDKFNAETQTLNQFLNSQKEKSRTKHIDIMTKKKSNAQTVQLNSKFVRNRRKMKSSQKNTDQKIYGKKSETLKLTENEVDNKSNLNSENCVKIQQVSNKLKDVEKMKEDIVNDDETDSSNIIDETSNVFLSNSGLKTLSNSNSMDFNCQFDYEDMITQSSDIETQTALDELLYSNTPRCDDVHENDLFSELISLSDIQTQTTWPLIKEEESEKYFFDKKESLSLISTETQTIYNMQNIENNFEYSTSSYSYDVDKNSSLFEGVSPHFCFKETQTCFCFLDSPKLEDSLNNKVIPDNIDLLDGSHNNFKTSKSYICSRNANDSLGKLASCISMSAETQTQFPFDNSQFLSRKSDVLLSCSTIETQTCFEDSYLENVMDVDEVKNI